MVVDLAIRCVGISKLGSSVVHPEGCRIDMGRGEHYKGVEDKQRFFPTLEK